jgi:hypothetical protein
MVNAASKTMVCIVVESSESAARMTGSEYNQNHIIPLHIETYEYSQMRQHGCGMRYWQLSVGQLPGRFIFIEWLKYCYQY